VYLTYLLALTSCSMRGPGSASSYGKQGL
jgi:hypothetical protein